MTAPRPEAFARFARHRAVRFLAVGALNTCFGYAVFMVALTILDNATASALISTVVGVLFNYRTIGRLVFESSESGLFARFVAVYALIFIVNAGALAGLGALRISPIIAQAGLLPFLAALSYFLNRDLVFRTRPAGATT